MICPDCEKGMIVGLAYKVHDHPYRETSILTHPTKYFHKVACPRCNGSGISYCRDGEDASQPDPLIGDKASTGEVETLVA